MFEMDERSSDFNENDDRARTRDNPRPFFNAAAQPRRCVKNTRKQSCQRAFILVLPEKKLR
jgi:hypothetical protein